MPAAANEVESILKKTGQVTLDSNGNGTIIFDPDSANQRWEIHNVVVSTNQSSTTTPYPTAEIFIGSPTSPGNSKGATWTGNQDTFSGDVPMNAAEEMFVVFTGGVVGSVAFARVTGFKYTRVR